MATTTAEAGRWQRLNLIPPGIAGVRRRFGLSFAVGWMPMAVLAAIAGPLRGAPAEGPFVLDLATHVRMLLVVPLLLITERAAAHLVARAIEQFVDEGLIPREDRRFQSAAAAWHDWRQNNAVAACLL